MPSDFEPSNMVRFPSRAERLPDSERSLVVERPFARETARVAFDRRELQLILNVYGRHVAAGEWRDYAIDFGPTKAVFSIFRRAAEVPLFRVEKDPKLARRQGAYSVIAATGLILRRGQELDRVLAVFDKPARLVR